MQSREAQLKINHKRCSEGYGHQKTLRQEVYIESGEIGSREFVSQLTAIKSPEKKKREKMQSENFVTTFGEQSSTHGVLCVLERYGHRDRV